MIQRLYNSFNKTHTIAGDGSFSKICLHFLSSKEQLSSKELPDPNDIKIVYSLRARDCFLLLYLFRTKPKQFLVENRYQKSQRKSKLKFQAECKIKILGGNQKLNFRPKPKLKFQVEIKNEVLVGNQRTNLSRKLNMKILGVNIY